MNQNDDTMTAIGTIETGRGFGDRVYTAHGQACRFLGDVTLTHSSKEGNKKMGGKAFDYGLDSGYTMGDLTVGSPTPVRSRSILLYGLK